MDSSLTNMWVGFFTAAGIPSDVGATYALTFTENRIQSDMLLDLNKEYLRDMGISRMGDVIAILRHAKQVHEMAARDRVLSSASPKVPVAAVTGRLTTTQNKPSSPASRILEHYTRNSPVPSTPEGSPTRYPVQQSAVAVAPKRKLADIPTKDTIMEIKKSRLIRFGNPVTPTLPEGPVSKQTVFARLGSSEANKNITVNTTTKPNTTSKPIYSRLGAKSDAQSQPQEVPIQKDALRYEGILKAPIKNVISVTATKNSVRKIAMGTMRADETPVSVKEKLALPKAKSVKFSNTVEYKEIESVPKAGIEALKFTSVFNKPERRLSMTDVPNTLEKNSGIKSRLGNRGSNNLTITRDIFNRLGAS